MLQQYYQAKSAHPGVLMAIRVGDFFEFYGEDAVTAAELLQITLTGREDGKNGRIPMAGVPFHSVEKYLSRLLQQGVKVALCDQVEDPKLAKKLVRREVTRVLSPGTVVEDAFLAGTANATLAGVCLMEGRAGIAILDPSTGEFMATEIDGDRLEERVLQELARLKPAELVCGDPGNPVALAAKSGLGTAVSQAPEPNQVRAEEKLRRHFDVETLAGFGVDGKPSAIVAASMALDYAANSGLGLSHVDSLACYSVDGFMKLDPATRRSLELTQNIADGGRKHTLLAVVDSTKTLMGARLLRKWIEQPLLDPVPIQERQGAVARFIEHTLTRGEIRDILKKLGDLERLVGRACSGHATPRDLSSLKTTLHALPDLDDALRKCALDRLAELRRQMGDHRGLAFDLHRAIVDDAPLTVREGGIFKPEWDPELDELRRLNRSGRDFIAKLEAEERQKTGLDKLKVGYNSVFGYYLELPKNLAERAPDHYIRKQTTANAERYITAELKQHESAVLGAEEKSLALEADLFIQLRLRVAAQSKELLQTARAISELDVLASLAESAVTLGFVKPEIVDEDVIEIQSGRHPVVESTSGSFVPNDLSLQSQQRLMILTGPNMSGKSTFLRQAALIVLLAQIGSFVPAKACRLGLCDRIFTRIGAKDELALGQSTFMVEMTESANILNNATSRSLVILDEVGRGTSTFDGLAIAWAMVEHLAAIGSKTLFATHYHQMNAIAGQISTVFNCRVSVQEVGDQVVWTHRVLPGGTDRSYGIQVARMAGVPKPILNRAAEILGQLEEKETSPKAAGPSLQKMQLTLFEAEEPEVVGLLRDLDVEQLSPMQALLKLDELKRRL